MSESIRHYAEGLAMDAAREQDEARKARERERCQECHMIGGHSISCSHHPDPPGRPCECYSCDKQCGGTDHPGWCGPTEADPEGRPICQVCRGLALVWDAYRVGVAAHIDQERIRTTVKFGESAWLNPASARALGRQLVALADELDAQLGTTPEVVALADHIEATPAEVAEWAARRASQ